MIAQVTSRAAAAQRLRDLAGLRSVRDRIDREYAQPQDVEVLAGGAHMSAGHFKPRVSARLRCAAQSLSAPDSSRDVRDAVLPRESGDQTDQESRSTGH